jgi:hypothetical protein
VPYDIEGEKVSDNWSGDSWEDGWFQGEGGLWARVGLDGQMPAANANKLPILMLKRAKKKGGGYLGNAAVSESGSHISVTLRSNVTYGLVFEAETAPDRKLGQWFCLTGQPNTVLMPAVNRYDPKFSGSSNYTSIKVDDVPTLERNHPGVMWSQWFVFTVRAWNITGFIDKDGKQHGTKLKPQGETTTVTVSGGGANPGDPLPIDESQFLRVREIFKAPGLPKGIDIRLFVYANADLIRQNIQAHEMAPIGDLR